MQDFAHGVLNQVDRYLLCKSEAMLHIQYAVYNLLQAGEKSLLSA